MPPIDILRVRRAVNPPALGNLTDEVLPPQPIFPVYVGRPKF